MAGQRPSIRAWLLRTLIPWDYRRALFLLGIYGALVEKVEGYKVAFIVYSFNLSIQGNDAIRVTETAGRWMNYSHRSLKSELRTLMEHPDDDTVLDHVETILNNLPLWLRYTNIEQIRPELILFRKSVRCLKTM